MFGTISIDNFNIEKEKEVTKSYYASKEVQIEQLRRNIEKGLSYYQLSLCVDRLVEGGCLTRSQANKYKRWHRKITRGEL